MDQAKKDKCLTKASPERRTALFEVTKPTGTTSSGKRNHISVHCASVEAEIYEIRMLEFTPYSAGLLLSGRLI